MNSVQSQKRYDQVCIISRYQNYNWRSVIVKSCPDRSQKCIFSYSENESTPAVLFPRRWDNPPLLWQSAPTFRKTVQIQELCLSQKLTLIPIAEVAWIWVVQEDEGELHNKPRKYASHNPAEKSGERTGITLYGSFLKPEGTMRGKLRIGLEICIENVALANYTATRNLG